MLEKLPESRVLPLRALLNHLSKDDFLSLLLYYEHLSYRVKQESDTNQICLQAGVGQHRGTELSVNY